MLILLTSFSLFRSRPVPAIAAEQPLKVNVSKQINPFTNEHLGVALVNWEHHWGRPLPGNVPNLAAVMQAGNVGVIRYAGGLWANYVGWDAKATGSTNTGFSKNGNSYSYEYFVDEITNVTTFANDIGAQVMIQVNVSNNDPQMWADMVTYFNKSGRKDSKGRPLYIKYWELGNEIDLESERNTSAGLTPDEYKSRLKGYQNALLAADSSIEVIGGVPAYPVQPSGNNTALNPFLKAALDGAKENNKPMGSLSYHWYQACNTNDQVADALRYQHDNIAPDHWKTSYARSFADVYPKRIESLMSPYATRRQGITELNIDSCNHDNPVNGNHIGAIWFSDILGRLAYNGVDYITSFVGYTTQGYGLIAPVFSGEHQNVFERFYIRPTFYAFVLYAQYFGNQMVETQTYNQRDISIWASLDSADPGKLKLMVTNMTGTAITAPVEITGFTAASGQAYTMTSPNPTDMSGASSGENASTRINGVKLDANNIASSLAQIKGTPVSVSNGTVTHTFPAYSTTAIVLSGSGAVTAAPTSAQPTLTTGPTATPVPVTPVPTSDTGVDCGMWKKYGDANCDKVVNQNDYTIWKDEYFKKTNTKNADFNSDSKVSLIDLDIWVRGFVDKILPG